MIDAQDYRHRLDTLLVQTLDSLTSAEFYAQIGLIIIAILVSYSVANVIKSYSPLMSEPDSKSAFKTVKRSFYATRDFIFPLIVILVLGICTELAIQIFGQGFLLRGAQSLAVVFMLYTLIDRVVKNNLTRKIVRSVAIPLALLYVFGLLDDISAYLDQIYLQLGNIRISLNGIARVLIFGSLLFWLGRISNAAGQNLIRKQQDLDIGTREVFAKLFQVILFFVIFLLLLQIMGINLTALAVFGGALGVGLGFGLQAIASNFVSGIILLLDRSLSVGDYIELEDGRTGTIRDIDMRSTTLETFDGKDIMVPNEKFITGSFVNWTHKNKKQRYALNFQVAYKTDLHNLFSLLRQTVASHPKVLSGPDYPYEEQPDAEICGFGDSGIDILVEFWMEGIDDGENRVGSDLLLMIWDVMKEHHMEIPFPQREVKILDQK